MVTCLSYDSRRTKGFGVVCAVVQRSQQSEAANRTLGTDGRRPWQPKNIARCDGKDEIVMPATSLVSAGEAERGRKGNEGKALGYGSRLASSSNPPLQCAISASTTPSMSGFVSLRWTSQYLIICKGKLNRNIK
jgi:hypothetical protein